MFVVSCLGLYALIHAARGAEDDVGYVALGRLELRWLLERGNCEVGRIKWKG